MEKVVLAALLRQSAVRVFLRSWLKGRLLQVIPNKNLSDGQIEKEFFVKMRPTSLIRRFIKGDEVVF